MVARNKNRKRAAAKGAKGAKKARPSVECRVVSMASSTLFMGLVETFLFDDAEDAHEIFHRFLGRLIILCGSTQADFGPILMAWQTCLEPLCLIDQAAEQAKKRLFRIRDLLEDEDALRAMLVNCRSELVGEVG